VVLYYITDRRQFPGTEAEKRERLLAKIAEAARAGVDLIQLREKDLSGHELERLARAAIEAIARQTRTGKREPRLLINSRTDIALAVGADGVHLTSNDISAGDARALWAIAARNTKRETRNLTIGVSCHTVDEILLAESQGADFAVFGPVYEKVGQKTTGIEGLRRACNRAVPRDGKTEAVNSGTMPVLALGGVTLQNAHACVEAGATGIAAIRLFQENEVLKVVSALKNRMAAEQRR
jgi:thiamine-phosphate pyrophosphorylase